MVDFDPAVLAPYFTYNTTFPGVTNGPGVLYIKANYQRVAIAISSQSASIVITPGVGAAAGLGLIIPQSQAFTLLKFADWGGLICMEWYASTLVGNAQTCVVETIFTPKGKK